MDTIYGTLAIISVLLQINSVSSFCVTGCSCTDDGFGRSLLCMETSLGRIPNNIPPDFTKIRVENSHLTEIPQRSFSSVSALESLWLNFNDITLMNIKSLEGLTNLTELRLEGNKLRSIPWTAFQDTPNLKILDLKHNRLDVLPESALRHLSGLTYLDLSFNQLTVISRDVFLNWPRFQRPRPGRSEERTANAVLALHDNHWLCDCRLKGFVEFIKSVSPPVILMNSYLTCAGPASKEGKFFHEVELTSCMKPETSTAQANVTLSLGASTSLQCLVKARPEPVVRWIYNLKNIRGFTVSQTQVDEDTINSQLLIPSLHLVDRGVYTCTANNFIGNSSVRITVNVLPSNVSFKASAPYPLASAEDNVYIDFRIAKQTIYGITVEWFAVTDNPANTWYTIHFGRFDTPKAEMIYIGPGITSYSVDKLQPLTKYKVCVALRNQTPLAGQCIVFMTGSDVNELEKRERLIHIIVIVCAMVLAVPAGMYACTTDARVGCCHRLTEVVRSIQEHRKRVERSSDAASGERQGTFDSLQAASDEGLCRESVGDGRMRRRSEDKVQKGNSAQLY
ncbi:leucine-rich repeat, immunoglobulin-like domain and transmembrane domain-containing protein 2 [Alosa sapidissima]|uniref:leucine-rich repeat, immunoglobulin-like domain and transmembrane domain-containing protein 2 n=1 Tax=Alosa sapidissima TaxID=34773 RepID=UPI001C08BC91|nr:leucine-rich repeat, immunoglobulin-like domain and transmembrane domain-containing protein 2 [Alosa sapidissima]